jgi:hypothetical protein
MDIPQYDKNSTPVKKQKLINEDNEHVGIVQTSTPTQMSVYNKHLIYKIRFDIGKFVATEVVITLSVRQMELFVEQFQRIILQI